MDFKEIKKDLFTMTEDYDLAHCISADAKMGAGIAVEFRKRFKLKSLQDMADKNPLQIGKCYRVGRALNLITKSKYWHKPSYESITQAVVSMKELCLAEGITKLAMPQIGCGLDKLQWGKVREIITEVFEDTEVEIIVCHYR
ncbi:macro domain-containing protein [Paenibacillus glycanilyticus]|uniref:macro domain-containing protein n=1 Tax=Paenibacillus glycanilyticus TaxID=126569 RepID=UPI00191019CA|nr:macro domain-containing protein [Paenibacillus glycanilyticus]